MPRPITPATYSLSAPDPSTLDDDLVARARRIAKRAKKIIETKGWAQRTSVGPDGGVCLSEALDQARQVKSKKGAPPLISSEMSRALAGVLETARPKVTRRARSFVHTGSVIDWNDRPNRTKEQVVALLEAAEQG